MGSTTDSVLLTIAIAGLRVRSGWMASGGTGVPLVRRRYPRVSIVRWASDRFHGWSFGCLLTRLECHRDLMAELEC
ncbi:unnamed protein product [Macrosiphum euphorbiae]|uniref:Secreted protein n=1 Tax=Macrosiphum euphorbiae TaxID=13131 RepID=A0AAV0WGS0_9HEMI|nr:unnamed protein product [Macrosiphum euphorbiae]